MNLQKRVLAVLSLSVLTAIAIYGITLMLGYGELDGDYTIPMMIRRTSLILVEIATPILMVAAAIFGRRLLMSAILIFRVLMNVVFTMWSYTLLSKRTMVVTAVSILLILGIMGFVRGKLKYPYAVLLIAVCAVINLAAGGVAESVMDALQVHQTYALEQAMQCAASLLLYVVPIALYPILGRTEAADAGSLHTAQ